MTRNGINITAWGTVISAIAIAAFTFPQIAKTAENQQVRAQAMAQYKALNAYSKTESHAQLNYWMGSENDALTTLVDIEASKAGTHLKPAAEAKCLAEAIYYEARSETRTGQKAVAEVVMNRVKNKHFPSTVCGVVYEGSERSTGCQFTFTCDGSMELSPTGKSWDRSVDMANSVLTGGHAHVTQWATHYHTLQVNPDWSQTMRMTRRVGSHVFYRFAPRNYKPSEPALLLAPPI